jgi:metal-responsive CopG/Arc/MetJ family transcriptional regulator
MKANVNIPEEVLEKTDKRAKALGISRSAFITMTLSEKLMQSDLMDSIPQMLETIKIMSENEKK